MIYLYALGGLFLMWAIWQSSRPQACFVVRVKDGQIETVSGKVTAAFLERIREVTERFQIIHGEICGRLIARRIHLKFTEDFSNEAAQQLRNWWSMHGWRRR
jgi:hypothetical protein